MKRRLRKVVNFFAFNLLFFALYLNFIHKDKTGVEAAPVQNTTTISTGTVLVQNPEKYLENKANTSQAEKHISSKEENVSVAKHPVN